MFQGPDLYAYLKCPVHVVTKLLSKLDVFSNSIPEPLAREQGVSFKQFAEQFHLSSGGVNVVDHPMLSSWLRSSLKSVPQTIAADGLSHYVAYIFIWIDETVVTQFGKVKLHPVYLTLLNFPLSIMQSAHGNKLLGLIPVDSDYPIVPEYMHSTYKAMGMQAVLHAISRDLDSVTLSGLTFSYMHGHHLSNIRLFPILAYIGGDLPALKLFTGILNCSTENISSPCLQYFFPKVINS